MFAGRPFASSVALWLLLAGAASCGGTSSDESVEPVASSIRAEPAPALTDTVANADVDTVMNDKVAADPASTVVAARSRGQQSTPERTQATSSRPASIRAASIRDIDFMNNFAFEALALDSDLITVVDGDYQNGEPGDPDYFWFGVTGIEFGDLDGDGTEDAVVSTSWNGGGTGYFDSVAAFRLVDGRATAAGEVLFGDRADGGIFTMRIENDAVSVWSFSTTLGACCPNQITRNTLVLGQHSLVHAARDTTRTWLSLNDYTEDPELKFLPGTSSAAVAVYGHTRDGFFTFEADQGQTLTFALTNGPAPADISMTDLTTGNILSGLAEMVLPSTGIYEVHVGFGAVRNDTTSLDVIIDGGGTQLPVQWTPAVEQVLITQEPFVRTSLVWPVFVSDQPGTATANQELADFVTQLDDFWIRDVTEYFDPLDDSSYEVDFTVTLVTSDLVSVRFHFYDYVCCRPYPNYGPVTAVADLSAGRLLTLDEIVDVDRMNEITDLWIAEGIAQEVIPETTRLVGERPTFDSLALTPDGVEFGTIRNSLGGGIPSTLVVVTYEILGDLVRPQLLARIAAG